jgi:hypothetical protein
MGQQSLFEQIADITRPVYVVKKFGGDTYESAFDEKRLTGQWSRVWSIMSDGQWRTLGEIQAQSHIRFQKHDSESAISARLRDFRKEVFGGHTVDRRRRGEAEKGLFEYRVIVKKESL